jgi:hypothetical protein
MSEDADAYGEQEGDRYLILANEKARGIINKAFEGAPDIPWAPVDDPPYLGMAVGDRTEGWVLLCAVFNAGLIAQHWCEECDGWHTITKKSAEQFLESLS